MLYEDFFPSVNERDEVAFWVYVPAAEQKGVIQLVHGFGEHSRRYLHMIMHFVQKGYVVAADDHVGHGRTAMISDTWGDWGHHGFKTMVEDEKRLHDLVKKEFPGLPYMMFGHSMGSVITREYMADYGSDLHAAALCGTCGDFPTADARKVLQGLVDEGLGEESDPEAAAGFMGWMVERCEDPTIGNEWICSDPYVQIDHAEDPFNAFSRPTSNEAMLDFVEMIDDVKGEEWAAKVPKNLPVYSTGGDQDPFGSYAQGLYQVSNWLIATGHHVTTKVYSGYRHEVHNYPDIQAEVEKSLTDFFDSTLQSIE